jgi:Phosphotransferase enzyme family
MEAEADLTLCLPAELRGEPITRVAAGLSGAGVYRVGEAYILKVAAAQASSLEAWRHQLEIQRAAGAAGLAPRVVHADEARRAVVSELVVDRSFPMWFFTPQTRALALTSLGQTLRRVHELPAHGAPAQPLTLLAALGAKLEGFPLPAFVVETTARLRAEPPPPFDGPLVLCHNDVNPTNLIFDGERVLLLDWDTAAPHSPTYDLAAAAVFLRMDEATCLALLSAHDGAPVTELPPRFGYDRRLVGVLAGSAFLHLARQSGHPGDPDAAAPALADVYAQLRAGTLSPATAAGQWAFGLALVGTAAS